MIPPNQASIIPKIKANRTVRGIQCESSTPTALYKYSFVNVENTNKNHVFITIKLLIIVFE